MVYRLEVVGFGYQSALFETQEVVTLIFNTAKQVAIKQSSNLW